MKKNYPILFFIILIISACGGSKKVQQQVQAPVYPPKPNWAQSRPITGNYYIGIGLANKRVSPTDFQQVAKNNALNDLASEIKVNINANSMLTQIESNSRFKEDFISATRLNTKLDLQDFEVVDSWENESEYWIYYRLSKSEYKAQQQKKIDNSVNAALNNFNRAKSLEKQGENSEALRNYLAAMIDVKPWLAENLETNIDGKQVFLGNEIYKSIQDNISSYQIIPSINTLKVKLGDSIDSEKIFFTVQDRKGKKLVNIPVQVKYTNGKVTMVQESSMIDGKVLFKIDKIRQPSQLNQEIEATINLQEIFTKTGDDLIKRMAKSFKTPSAKIVLQLENPKFFVKSNEKNMGESIKGGYLSNTVSKIASTNNFKVVASEKEADYIIDVMVNSTSVGKSFDMETATLNGVVSVFNNKTKAEVYSRNISNQRGVHLKVNEAGLNAYERAAQQLEKSFMEDFLEALLQ
jgi:hypothetical protein